MRGRERRCLLAGAERKAAATGGALGEREQGPGEARGRASVAAAPRGPGRQQHERFQPTGVLEGASEGPSTVPGDRGEGADGQPRGRRFGRGSERRGHVPGRLAEPGAGRRGGCGPRPAAARRSGRGGARDGGERPRAGGGVARGAGARARHCTGALASGGRQDERSDRLRRAGSPGLPCGAGANGEARPAAESAAVRTGLQQRRRGE
mmetsp:Transcript_8410/g.31670  ORF Transcript_8410/g.31670 Transcript_8410/m.31670 type:complete len:208 (-) Transcript_8410:590-1213(-)